MSQSANMKKIGLLWNWSFGKTSINSDMQDQMLCIVKVKQDSKKYRLDY